MSAVRPVVEIAQAAPVPVLLVELPPRHRVFLQNLRDLIFPRRLAPLELRSAPAAFWPDVFVKRRLPWSRFLESGACHLIAIGLLMGLSHLLDLQPRIETKPKFDRSEVTYYRSSEYLPPIDTRSISSAAASKADPEIARQPIISVPPEAENHSQTVVTPPKVRLKRDVSLPNMVAWSNEAQKPRLAIPAPPLTPASEITRIAPKLNAAVVTPPPEADRLKERRRTPGLQSSVVAPPPDVKASRATGFEGLQPALIAPPPTVETASNRTLGEMNIAPSAVIAPAPQLPIAAQRTAPRGGPGTAVQVGAEVVPPPPAVQGASGNSGGSRGHIIALGLHPAVSAPLELPAGNRRGSFAATPEGHAGATGAAGSSTTGSGESGSKRTSELPSGLYVGAEASTPASVSGTGKTASNEVNPNLIASVRPPRVGAAARPMQPSDESKLLEPEREVFGGRKFYSVTLNMPNLNSAGGSWVIRFAELHRDSTQHTPETPASDLTQPMATRKVDPAYPTQLMRENVKGTVILYAVIHADGTVGDVRVLRSVDERLDRYASQAVAQWKFDPATKNGMPVDVEATFQIPFRPTRFGTSF